MKKRLKAVTQQAERLTEEITDKEASLAKAHQEHQETEREKDALKVRPLTHKPYYKGWLPWFQRLHHVPGLWQLSCCILKKSSAIEAQDLGTI